VRITLIGPAYPLRGGIAHHTFLLHQELIERGHTVQVISFSRLYPKFLFPGKRMTDESRLRLDVGAHQVLDSLNPKSWFTTRSLISRFSPDLIVIEWWSPAVAPAIGTLVRLLRRAGRPIVMECHNVFPHERSPLDFFLVDFALGPVAHFITHSEQDQRLLLATWPGKSVRVVPLPVPEVFFESASGARDGKKILLFGVIRPYKGLDVLLRAMALLIAKVQCSLLIAGEFYEPKAKYLQLIADYKLEKHVRLDQRYIPNEEIAGLFRDADVLVLPYLSATQSGVARMALATGLPMIASRVGGLSEVVTENVNGLLVPPGKPEALADALTRYFKDGLGPRFSNNIRSAAAADRFILTRALEEMAGSANC
jgi:glycosyltransferase involved in cell wall biosynthesis